MAVEAATSELVKVVALLGAAVVMVPLFRRAGLGSVLGYFAAGLAIGPFGLGWFSDPQAILHTAELGVVMFLFVIGLEMRPSHLWSLRKEIFGLGTLQIVTCALVLTSIAKLFGLPWQVAFIGATGFVLTSTAVVMQLLAERGDIALPSGQKIVSILLFEDLLIVPLLALVAWMGPSAGSADGEGSRWLSVAIGVGAIVGLVLVGRFLLNPLFRVLAESKAREVMTAAALLVVLGAALLMQLSGLSMAMGAFLAGVLLSESTFRHQIEADIEPFRGILLGLFFLSVGMALDLSVVAAHWQLILGLVLALMAAKALCIYVVARIMGSDHAQALDRGVLMAQGGEFAFVLFSGGRIGRRDRPGDQCQLHRRGGAVDGADPAGGAGLQAHRTEADGEHGRCGRGRRPVRQRAADRLRPLRPGREPVAAGARRGRDHHRQRCGDDPERRALRFQDLLR